MLTIKLTRGSAAAVTVQGQITVLSLLMRWRSIKPTNLINAELRSEKHTVCTCQYDSRGSTFSVTISDCKAFSLSVNRESFSFNAALRALLAEWTDAAMIRGERGCYSVAMPTSLRFQSYPHFLTLV